MEGSARVFAGDFCRSTLHCPVPGTSSPLYVVTPAGVWCNLVFLSGVLTEVSGSGTRIRCRLADPTGAFDLEAESLTKNGSIRMLITLPIPSFISISGRACMARGSESASPVVRVDTVRVVDRSVRDGWIARTADSTLHDIGALADALQKRNGGEKERAVLSHYRATPDDLLSSILMVESAIAGLTAAAITAAPGQPDARETVTGIIRDLQGPRGIAVEEVIAQAGIRGIMPDTAKKTIEDLIREDECYQPQKGSLRLL